LIFTECGVPDQATQDLLKAIAFAPEVVRAALSDMKEAVEG